MHDHTNSRNDISTLLSFVFRFQHLSLPAEEDRVKITAANASAPKVFSTLMERCFDLTCQFRMQEGGAAGAGRRGLTLESTLHPLAFFFFFFFSSHFDGKTRWELGVENRILGKNQGQKLSMATVVRTLEPSIRNQLHTMKEKKCSSPNYEFHLCSRDQQLPVLTKGERVFFIALMPVWD